MEFHAEAVGMMAKDDGADSVYENSASERRPGRRSERSAGRRDVEQLGVDRDTVLEQQSGTLAKFSEAIVRASHFIREPMAVNQPHNLRREFFPLVLRDFKLKGEAVRQDARDRALKAADMLEVGDDALADLDPRRGSTAAPARLCCRGYNRPAWCGPSARHGLHFSRRVQR